MDAAYLLHRVDWAFWAAAWDAAAAIAAEEHIGSGYGVLARPLMTVMPSLSETSTGARVPAQRGGTRAGERRDEVGQSRTRKTPAAGHETHSPGKKLAGGGDEEPVRAAV